MIGEIVRDETFLAQKAEPISNAVGGIARFAAMYFMVYRNLGREGDWGL